MKFRFISAAFPFLTALFILQACTQTETATGPPQNHTDSLSYVLGANFAKYYKDLNAEVDEDQLVKGFRDAMKGGELALSEESADQLMKQFALTLQKLMADKAQRDAVANQIVGQKFLEENKTKEGVIELPSGLQYKVLATGNGNSPTETNVVKAAYTGRLTDGTIFVSSEAEPDGVGEIIINRVIPGWTEALLMMKPGDKWELFIPPSLAYGSAGRESIPPNSVLIFELELREIVR